MENIKLNSSGHHKPFLKVKNESGSEDVHFSLFYEGLPEEFRKKAEKELNETEENRTRGLQHLKECMKRENLPFLRDELLVAILRNCKYNLKKSEVKLKKATKTYHETFKILSEIGMEKIKAIIDDMPMGALPYRDKQGSVIMYTRPYGLDLDLYDVDDVAAVLMAFGLLLLTYPITSVAGFTYFGECKSPSLSLFYPIFKTMKRYVFVMYTLPFRISRLEILNVNSLCRCFITIIKPLLSSKVFGRISTHGSDMGRLHKDYPSDILPEDFDGTLGPLRNTYYKQKLLDYISDLIKENS